ncbi:penicillin-binding transpeptidase domain-containing protein [Actinophytocola xinjiangensis]|uniref:penicillin-binding transpeptidase domain-containing protein n=1 Tax=Actinophytocola xinjiangensis TaxID=485602 RepID=UPI000AC08BAE|nr:penicillin-binding transpeptidase domain-containing protein [Actinophytocola xinjiangensis]
MRTGQKRLVVAVGFVLVAAITTVGVFQLLPNGTDTSGPAPTTTAEPALTPSGLADQFLDRFTAGDPQAAGALTDDPAAATTVLSDLWRTLLPKSVTATRDGLVEAPAGASTVDQPFTITWDFGQERTWTYPSVLRVVRDERGWLVAWRSELVHPKLTAGRGLAFRDLTGKPAVLGSDDAPLLTWSPTGPVAECPASLLTPALGRVAAGRAGTPGWFIALTDGAGQDVSALHGSGTAPLRTSLSGAVQRAAQSAVDSDRYAAAVVALRPSTGELLAVAQNASAGDQPIALSGLYPPGSTFKVATAAAMISAGRADVGTVLPCPGSVTVGERTIDNANFALGDVPLRTAFARSCNTTFALGAADLSPDALPAAATQLGLGADFEIPGIVTELGTVRPAANTAEQVENSIGQGTVRASPLGLALMAATVAHGAPVTPTLWAALDTKTVTAYTAPPPEVLTSLRTLMRAVVTDGLGAPLARFGEVHGKTGTAEVSGGAHGWFIGYRDDLAFATLVIDASTSSAAVDLTARFLGAL